MNIFNKIKLGLYICKKVEWFGNYDNSGDFCEILCESICDYYDELVKK